MVRFISASFLVFVGLALVGSPALAAPGEWTKVYGANLSNLNGGLQLQEEYSFGSHNNSWSNFFTRLTNGEYVFYSYAKTKNVYSTKINRLAKTGTLLSTKAVHLAAVAATPDGGYVGVSVAKAGATWDKDAKIIHSLIKFKKNGQTEWKKTIPTKPGATLILNLVTVTAQGGYIVGGASFVSEVGYDAYLLKFSKNGTLEKDFVVAPAGESPWMNSLRPTSDGGVVISGHRMNLGGSNHTTAWAAKLDNDLDLSWENIFGCDESATYAEETKDGNVVVASNVKTGYTTDPKLWSYETQRLFSAGRLSTFDTEGNLVEEGVHQALFPDDSQVQGCLVKEGTQDNYVEDPVAYKINMVKPTSDGGLFLVGTRSTGIKSAQQRDRVWVRKLDAEGTVLWDKTFTDAGGDSQFGLTGFQVSPTLYTVIGTKKNGQRVVRSFVGK